MSVNSVYVQLGTSGSFMAPASGQLILQCEDSVRGDNSGSLPVTIDGGVYLAQCASDTNGPIVVAGQSYQFSVPQGDYWAGGTATTAGAILFNADGVPAATGNDPSFSAAAGFPKDNPDGLRAFSLVGRMDIPAPTAPGAPQIVAQSIHSVTVAALGALPAGANTVSLQIALDNGSNAPGPFSDVPNGEQRPDGSYVVTNLAAAGKYWFRWVAQNAGGDTPGQSLSEVTALAPPLDSQSAGGVYRLYSSGVLEADIDFGDGPQSISFATVQDATISCQFQEKTVHGPAQTSRFPQATGYHDGMWSVRINAGDFSSEALQLLAAMRAGQEGSGYVASVIADGEIVMPEFTGTFTSYTSDLKPIIWQFRKLLSKGQTLPFKINDFLYGGFDLSAVADDTDGIVDLLIGI